MLNIGWRVINFALRNDNAINMSEIQFFFQQTRKAGDYLPHDNDDQGNAFVVEKIYSARYEEKFPSTLLQRQVSSKLNADWPGAGAVQMEALRPGKK